MTLIENISEIALSKLQPIDGYVVEVNMRGERGSSIVEVYVDTDNGITADQCAQVNRHLATELDRLNLISGRYRLEVSSPGLDRPLKLGRQFIKNIGRQLKIISSDDSGKNATEGILQNANESTLTLVTRDKGERIFALNDIQEAYVLPKFK
ncbi:MAG: ribosome maturation factor RimP [Bacteroidota bacterium]